MVSALKRLQGKDFNAQQWSCEYCQLQTQAMQKKLAQYWHLPDVRSQLSLPAEATEDEKLQAITGNFAAKCAEWANSILEDMATIDIKQASAIASVVAETTVTMFQQGTSHALQSWADEEEAAKNLSRFLGGLGLEVQSCDGPVQAVYAVGSGRQHSGSIELLNQVSLICYWPLSFC